MVLDSLFQRDKLVLFVVTVLAFVVFRNTFLIISNHGLVGFDDFYADSSNPGNTASDFSNKEVAQLVRSASPKSSPNKSVLQLLLKNSSLNHIISSSNKTVNDTKHPLLKANMSHVGAIVKELKQAQKPNEQVKYAKPHPFKYLINSPNICGKEDVFILIYIHTAPDHHKRRTIIRQTWGKIEQYDVPIKLVFVMGAHKLVKDLNETDVQKALFFESEQYGDIVQEDFLDTYHNLTHKGVTALKWITNYCSQAVYIVKTDDDIFVNMYTVLRHLKSMKHKLQDRGILMCAVWYQMTVVREGKWKVTFEEWPNSTYPTYCSGSAFILSTDVAITFYRVSYHVPFFWVDDFYITGLLPLKAGNITHKDLGSTFVLNGDLLEEKFTGPHWFMYTFSHVHNLNRIQAVWDTMSRLARGEISATIKMAKPGDLEKLDNLERKLLLL